MLHLQQHLFESNVQDITSLKMIFQPSKQIPLIYS